MIKSHNMAQENLSPYLERLKVLKELNLIQTPDTETAGGKHKFNPKIVFLDTEQGVSEVGDAIAQGWPVVTDYGATYGTAFPPNIREAVATARGETEPLATVSIVTFRDVAFGWMDTTRIHPDIVEALNEGKFDILTGISFIRFACNEKCQETLGHHYVNEKKEVQVFIVPDEDPLMAYLRKDHNLAYIAVRSSNVTGQQEQAFAPGAVKYAQAIGAPIMAVRSLDSFNVQIEDEHLVRQNQYVNLQRKRFGSQPIISLSSAEEPAVVTLVRAGNTDPSTLQSLMADIVSEKIGFVYVPEKVTSFSRQMYKTEDSVKSPQEIRKLLLEHSGIK
jgi:hypothetical protein